MTRFPGLALVLLGALVACVADPEPRSLRLDMPLPATWSSSEPEDGAVGEVAGGASWFLAYGGDRAAELVYEALVGNPDLAATGARLLAADARARVVGADRQPQVSAFLASERSKRNFIGFPGGFGAAGGDEPPSNRVTIHSLSLDVTWQADLWGRLATLEAAEQEDTAAAMADLAAAQLSLTGATLKAWFALTEALLQERLAERTRDSWLHTDRLVERRYAAGLRGALDRRITATNLAAAESELEARVRERREASRALELILGRVPRAEEVGLDDLPPLPSAPPVGLPVELLARRPDVHAAERRLRAAELRVDAAERDYYPDLSLTGSVGSSSEDLDDLLDGDFSVWRLLGQLTQPVFQGGRLAARVDFEDAVAQEAVASFTGVLLSALAEVERALDAERRLARQVVELDAAASHARAARALAEDRYAAGLEDVVTLLQTERDAQRAESAWLAARLAQLDARIDLHLALGGGFRIEPTHDRRPGPAGDEESRP